MTLREMCIRITKDEPNQLKDDKETGLRIMRPETSIHTEEVKTFPLTKNNRIFALCWNIQKDKELYATIVPSKQPFSYHTSFVSGSRTQAHTHAYIELAYVVEGEFRQKILGKEISFQKGELCLIDKNCLHQDYLLSKPTIIIFLGLANEIFDEVMVNEIAKEKITHFLQTALLKQKNLQQYLHFKPQNPDTGNLENCLTVLLSELSRQDEASKYICKGLLMRIFQIMSTEYDFSLSKELRNEMNWIVFGEITKYIQQNYATITIKELSEQFNFQEDYFNRLLKAKTGMKYTEYVRQLRLSHAEHLLKTTDRNIDDIIYEAGYHNKGYFYKIFLDKHGVTPAAYRENLK